MKFTILFAIILFSVLTIPAFAEQQASVKLPFDRPYVDTHCQTFFANTADSLKSRAVVNCYWVFEFDSAIFTDIQKIIPGTNTVPNEDLPPGVIDLINKNPPPKPEDQTKPTDEGSGIDDRIDTAKETITAIAKLADCYRGYDRSHEWGAFVDTQLIPYWLNSTREQFTERDNLSSQQAQITPDIRVPLLPILKAIEECSAIERYVFLGLIGSEEALKAVHDRLNIGKDGRPVPTIRANEGLPKHDSDSTKNIDNLKVAEIRAKDFACTDANIARKLCQPYSEFTGINRGIAGAIISTDVIVNSPGGSMTGKTAVEIYGMYKRSQTERDISLTDAKKYMAEINQLTCDNYFIIYKHQLGTKNFPEWLNTACMAGTKSTQYDLQLRHALE